MLGNRTSYLHSTFHSLGTFAYIVLSILPATQRDRRGRCPDSQFYREDPEIGLVNNSPVSLDHLSPCLLFQERDHRANVVVTWVKRAWGNFALKSQAHNTPDARGGGGEGWRDCNDAESGWRGQHADLGS